MPTELERRVLVYAPTNKDSALTCKVLGEKGITCLSCASVGQLIREMEQGVGAVILAEEAFVREDVRPIIEAVHAQPPWSDLPIILITRQGADSPMIAEAVKSLGNAILLERPTRVNSLLNAAQSALRAQRRRFHARSDRGTRRSFTCAAGE